ncbi:MAG: polysaccharide biosynthesis protein [Clostridia bacterium]|nr:polysaccharide biosynthesis protein [Clostridia bacterium]
MSKIQKNFMSGALILSVANILVKIIGAIYKIPLSNMIDTVGMNYYNDAYQIYSLLFVLSTAGVPIAIAKMVSESLVAKRLEEPKKILGISTKIFALIGAAFTLLLIGFAPMLSKMLSSETTNYCLILIAPAIFLVATTSTIKGYFQGYKCMQPTAIYQVLEAGFKLCGLALVAGLYYFTSYKTDPMVLACAGILGVTFGSFAASVYMVIRYLREKELGRSTEGTLPSRSNSSIAKTVLTLAIPISLSNAVMSVTSTLDMFLVKWNLSEYGLDADKVKDVYGAYAGATSSIFNLPPTITVTIGIAVLPFLTTAFAEKNIDFAHKNMRSSSKVIAIIAMPCALGMCLLSEPIVKSLFSSSYWEVGVPTLSLLAISVFFVAMVSLTGIFLQAAGKVKISLMTMGIGAVMKLTVNILAVRNIGIMGAPLGTFACYATIMVLNLIFIYKYSNFRLPLMANVIKPFLCSLLCCGGAYGVWRILNHVNFSIRLSLVAAIGVAGIIYVITLLLFRVLSKEDMTLIPKGDKIGSFLAKMGWLHE